MGIIFITLLLGFSNFCRAFLWWLWAHFGTLILVHTQLYRIWLDFRDKWGSQALYKSTEERVTKMKEEVRRTKALRRAERTKEADKRKAEEKGKTGETSTKPKKFFTRRKRTARADTPGTNGNAVQGPPTECGSIPLSNLAQSQHEGLSRAAGTSERNGAPDGRTRNWGRFSFSPRVRKSKGRSNDMV